MNGRMHKKICKIFVEENKNIKVIQTIYFGRKALYMTGEMLFNFVKSAIKKDKTIDFKDTQESLNKIRKVLGKEAKTE